MLQDIHSLRNPPARFGLPPEREAEAVLKVKANWAPGIEPHLPIGVSSAALPAKVNQGRWIVECPCGSAQLASRSDHRFFCVECGNVLFEGKWVRVEWPRDAAQIEQELQARPFASNRNWEPGESVSDLHAETTEHMATLEAQLKERS